MLWDLTVQVKYGGFRHPTVGKYPGARLTTPDIVCTLRVAMPSPSGVDLNDWTPEHLNVHALHSKLTQLRARDAVLTERIERDLREREEVREALSETEAELETVVQAPVAGGVDPTETLPDELLWMILVGVLVGGTCGRVCRRWHAVCAGATAKKQAWQQRWAGYARGSVTPCTLLVGGESTVVSLAVAVRGRLYGSGRDMQIQVWSTVTNTHLRTLHGHTDMVCALVVGKDGTVYSASADTTVRIWSGDDGSHLGTLAGHTHAVRCLAVGADGTVYSGSEDTTIRVWTYGWGEPRHLHTLEGHTDDVWSLALSKDGKLYSGSSDMTIGVWSPVDGSHIRTLEGHTADVYAVAVGADGTVYSGSQDGTLRMWSGLDGSLLRTLDMDVAVLTIAIGVGSTVFIGDVENRVSTWNSGRSLNRSRLSPVRTLYTFTGCVDTVAIGQDGQILVTCSGEHEHYEL
jgi:outer membrane protein assembly factor BamB